MVTNCTVALHQHELPASLASPPRHITEYHLARFLRARAKLFIPSFPVFFRFAFSMLTAPLLRSSVSDLAFANRISNPFLHSSTILCFILLVANFYTSI